MNISGNGLLSERLLIRAYIYPNDVDSAYRWKSDPENTRYDDWEPLSREETDEEVERLSRLPVDLTGEWHELSICRKEDGRNIGGAYYKVDSEEPTDCLVGIHLSMACQGHGYASEAMAGMRCYLGSRGVTRLFALIDSRNQRSIALFLRLGFVEQVEARRMIVAKGEESLELRFQYCYAD